jgi:hypothetical protein
MLRGQQPRTMTRRIAADAPTSECRRSLETEFQLSSGGEGSMARRKLTEATGHSGGVAAARWQGCSKQLEKPFSPRREIGGEGNRITGDTGKSVERRDVGGEVRRDRQLSNGERSRSIHPPAGVA